MSVEISSLIFFNRSPIFDYPENVNEIV